ncbi:TetR family transcriptional regulator C-terminal domain-containing protein [Microbacterium hominis]|nr:TetR family transcriptional regulator C-terminal domain-containing protein [Microbacterium hominis]QOC30229.1 TetR family transcriptional regulator C-terminal domain-containing protein [Microbacterium hominis]
MPRITAERIRLLLVQNGVLIALVLLIALFAILNPRFISVGNLQTIVLQIAELGLIALPVAFLIMQANVDLSVGSVATLSAVVGGLTMVGTGSPVAGIVVGVAVGACAGLVNGTLVSVLGLNSFVVTLGFMSAWSGLALFLTNGKTVSGLPSSFTSLGSFAPFGVRIQIILLVAAIVVAWWVLNHTARGREILAVGGNLRASQRREARRRQPDRRTGDGAGRTDGGPARRRRVRGRIRAHPQCPLRPRLRRRAQERARHPRHLPVHPDDPRRPDARDRGRPRPGDPAGGRALDRVERATPPAPLPAGAQPDERLEWAQRRPPPPRSEGETVPRLVDHEAMRTEIIRATWRLIAERGIAAMTMRELARELGFANGSITHYFPNKSAILTAAFELVYEATNTRYLAAIAQTHATGVAALRQFLVQTLPVDEERLLEARIVIPFLEHAAADDEMAELFRAMMTQWRAHFDALLAEAAASGELRPGLDPRAAGDALLALLTGVQGTGILLPDSREPARMEAMLDTALQMLR